jgi:hypothetical protein
MITTDKTSNSIIKELSNLSEDNKRELLTFIKLLKYRETDSTIKMIEETAAGWANLVDTEKLKEDIYKDRLISTRKEPSY